MRRPSTLDCIGGKDYETAAKRARPPIRPNKQYVLSWRNSWLAKRLGRIGQFPLTLVESVSKQFREKNSEHLFRGYATLRPGGKGPRGIDRDSAGEGIGLAILAEKGTGEIAAPSHGLGPADGLYQPLLLLPLGFGVGWDVLEDERLCTLPNLALAQCSPNGRSGNSRNLALHTKRSTMDSAPVRIPPQKICDRLGSGAVRSFLWRWLHRLPSPFTEEDFQAGYIYELAFRQFEVSETCVFDRPQAGRMWFEGVIRDHLDVGRPHQIALVFDRRINCRTPGVFRTEVVTKGVNPRLCYFYKSSRLKQ